MIVRHYKRMRPHKTKKEKSTADDDESDWVQAAVAVAGLGMSLWDRKKQDDADKDLKKQMQENKGTTAYSAIGIGQSLEGELELADERKEVQKDMMTEQMTGQLKSEMGKIHDGGGSFSNSYRDQQTSDQMQTSVWSGYKAGKQNIDTQYENQKIGAYSSAFASTADMRRQMDEIESQISQL